MTTLRRELRKVILDTLQNYYDDVQNGAIADIIADAALSLRAFSFQPQTIEQAIYAGVPVTEELAQKENLRDLAPKMFERALGFSKPLAWWSNKEWTAFAEWVCEIYAEDKLAFGNYNIWRHTPYTKGGMSNNRIRGFVAEFYDSWDMFKMANVKPAEENRPEYRRYVAPEQTEELIPNPKAKQR